MINYIVICREDAKEDGSPGDYTLATRTIFPTRDDARKYVLGCAAKRQAIIVEGRFAELRQDFDERFGEMAETIFVGKDSEIARRVSKATGHVTMKTMTWPDIRYLRKFFGG